MDNRAKAQAHIERAQMYLGFGQTEFGLLSETEMESLSQTRDQLIAAKKDNLASKAGNFYKGIQVDREMSKNYRKVMKEFRDLSNALASDLTNTIMLNVQQSKKDECEKSTNEFIKEWDPTSKHVRGDKVLATNMCIRNRMNNQLEPIILESMIKAKTDFGDFEHWQGLEKNLHSARVNLGKIQNSFTPKPSWDTLQTTNNMPAFVDKVSQSLKNNERNIITNHIIDMFLNQFRIERN